MTIHPMQILRNAVNKDRLVRFVIGATPAQVEALLEHIGLEVERCPGPLEPPAEHDEEELVVRAMTVHRRESRPLPEGAWDIRWHRRDP